MEISHASPKADTPTSTCGGCAVDSAPAKSPAAIGEDTKRFYIATMDCAAEESEIRRAVDPIAGIRHLRFDFGRRLLDLSGTPDAIDQAEAAMRRIGFDAQPFATAVDPTAAAPSIAAAVPFGAGLWRLVAALGLALGAEALAFFAPDLLPWRIATMALALVAIALAGLGTYTNGLAALRAGRLNINALMTVAVTGAFVIGQWPEAAMVMALYAIAELIETRAVDRARNAIRSLLALAPRPVARCRSSWRSSCGPPCSVRRSRSRCLWKSLASGVRATLALKIRDRPVRSMDPFERPSADDCCTLRPVVGVTISRPIL
jgi:Cd2+/Zn2+-exporting ATPase